MSKRLKSSPLADRIAPAPLMRHWLWSETRPYDGLLLPSPKGTEAVQLRYLPMAREIMATDAGVCILFNAPIVIDPATLGVALPLRACGSNSFSSYDLAANKRNAAPKTVNLIREGAHHHVSLDGAKRFDALDFWDFSKLHVVRSHSLLAESPWETGVAVPTSGASAAIAESVGTKPVFQDMRQRVEAKGKKGRHGSGSSPFRRLKSLFARRTFGPEGSGTGAPAPAPRPAGVPKYKGPGLLNRMMGWALWNTGLGNAMRSAMDRQMSQVSDLIERGEIDAALKRAFALGRDAEEKNKKRNANPTGLQKPRASLDLDFTGIDAPSASILTDGGFHHLADLYRKLAKDLSEQDDHQRAAFIYAELLSDPISAIAELEALKAFEDAARLAIARKRPPQEAIRLWFLAGRTDIALALAKRHDLLEFLSNTAAKTNPEFAAFVHEHWIDALIRAGDLTRAIIETADLPAFAPRRRKWAEQAILAGGIADPDMLTAGVSLLEWSFDAFGDQPPPPASDATSIVTQALFDILKDNAETGEYRRATLLTALRKHYDRGYATGSLTEERAAALTDRLIRSALAHADRAADVKLFKALSEQAGLRVLAEDLRHILRRKSKAESRDLQQPLPAPRKDAKLWPFVACVANQAVLIGGSDGEIAQIDTSGRRLWTDYLTDLVGIIPIGSGRLVCLLQGNTATRTMTLLDTATHSYRKLGQIDLIAWHQYASPTSFLVQTPKAVMSLDVTAMLGETPQFETLWSITQTVPLKVLCFRDSPDDISWVSQRTHPDGFGLIEVWEMSRATMELRTFIVLPNENERIYRDAHMLAHQRLTVSRTRKVTGGLKNHKYSGLNAPTYSYETEVRAMKAGSEVLGKITAFAPITAEEPFRAIGTCDPDATAATVLFGNVAGRVNLHLTGASIVAQSSTSKGQRVVITDNAGRLITFDSRRETITCLQV